ncbi:MAG: ATP-grasp domain-containing protein [Caldimicrobium thiodismutans]|jgi:ribosomal protein S6--L-glutamate ligase
MIISFLPSFKGDLNFFQFEPLDERFFEALSKARAVIFPPTVSQELYFFVKNLGIPVFPEYTYRFMYPGKIGQIILLKLLNLPHPKTILVPRLCGIEENPYKRPFNLQFPCVIKGNYGHEGEEVFLVNNKEEFEKVLKDIKSWEREGRFGFLIQEYIPSEFDARAIVIGDEILPFFRKGGFKKNLVQEGEITPCPKRNLKKKVLELTYSIIRNTYFNLVAIDFLFKEDEPLVCEFNFVFGRRALGEKNYERYLKKAIKNFLEKIK